MNIFDRIARALGWTAPDFTLDSVPVKALDCAADWRDEAVKRAAEKHGQPLKCGPDGVPRERFVGREMQKEIVRPKATVHQLNERRK